MVRKDLLKWGFKANSERLAVSFRKELEILPHEPLSAFDLALHLKIPIYDATVFVKNPNELKILSGESIDNDWSALTMLTKKKNQIIIHNPYHSPARQQSNIMHELSHIICKHKYPDVDYDFEVPVGMRIFDEVQEEEAKCLGATLQITREGLLWALRQKYSISEIAKYFSASEEMATYRIRMSGVVKQLQFRRKLSA